MRPRRQREGGFALLMVFVLAAVVAITLYIEMPRVAFESQRTKEQLLIDRGEQYKRAIQVFYRKNKRFPTTMDELEKFQDVRYLRQKYKDPMTGKDEWRLIHVGPGGQLTDSLIQKQNNPLGQNGQNGQNGQQGSNNQPGGGASNPGFSSSFGSQSANGQANGSGQPPTQYNANGIAISGADADTTGGAPSGLNMVNAKRRSDQMNLTGQNAGSAPANPGDPDAPQDPNAPQPANPPPTFTPPQTGTPPPDPNQPQQAQNGPNPAQPQPGTGFNPFQNAGNNNGAQPQQQSGFNNGANNAGANNPANAGGNNPALNAIQSSLFSPRPQGNFGGSNSSFSGNSPGGGVGIAGVATKYKGPSIKRVNERKKYQEWEFVYDMKKDKSLLGAGTVNALQNAQNAQQGQGQNNPGFSTGSSFGSGSSSQSQSQTQQQQQTQPPQQQQQQ